MSVGPEERQALVFAFLIGCAVVAGCRLLVGNLHRVAGSLVGLVLGLLIPVAGGWMWGQLPVVFQTLRWSFLEAWVDGLTIAIPSSIAGLFIGWVQSKRASGFMNPLHNR